MSTEDSSRPQRLRIAVRLVERIMPFGRSLTVIIFSSSLLVLISSGCNTSILGQPTPSVKEGAPVEWSKLYSLIREEVQKSDPDPVLYAVYAFVADPQLQQSYSYTEPLELLFDFAASDGSTKKITVRLIDSSPTATLGFDEAMPSYAPQIVQTPGEKEKYKNSLSTVQIGPREAIQKVWPDAIALAKERGVKIKSVVRLDLKEIPAVWEVQAVDLEKFGEWEVSPLDFSNFVSHARYKVNAQTGEIISIDHKQWSPGSP